MAEIGFEIETEFQNTLAYFKLLVSVAQMGSNHEKKEVNNLVTHSLIKNVYKNKKNIKNNQDIYLASFVLGCLGQVFSGNR